MATEMEPQVDGGAAAPQEEEIEISVTMTKSEAEQLIQVLNEAGLEDIAAMFQESLNPAPVDEAQVLQDEIVAAQPRMM
jgi:hypothetical protein